jgi:hypothetical protein
MKIFRMSIITGLIYSTNLIAQVTPYTNLLPSEKAFLSLTDSTTYNSYDFAGSPLGLLETEKRNLAADLRYRVNKWESGVPIGDNSTKSGMFSAPHFRAGAPGTLMFDLFYCPEVVSNSYNPFKEATSGEMKSVKIPLQRFGLSLAGGAMSGVIQAGLTGEGFIGNQTSDASMNNRVILGFQNVRLHIGSQIQELVRLGIFGGVDGYVDTLCSTNSLDQDRMFSGTLPVWGGYLDLSGKEFPVKSDMLFSKATPVFVYVVKPSDKPKGNQAAIKGDSLIWDWKTMVDIPIPDGIISPAFSLCYKKNKSQVSVPSDNNDPWAIGKAIGDSNWTASSFSFGFGTSYSFMNILKFDIDYSFRNLNLKTGMSYGNTSRKNGYHATAVKLKGNLENIKGLKIPESMELGIKAGYLNYYYNSFIDSWAENGTGLLYSISTGSQYDRYDPKNILAGDKRIAGFLTGIETSFFNKAVDVNFDILIKNVPGSKEKGTELGLNISYLLQSKSALK